MDITPKLFAGGRFWRLGLLVGITAVLALSVHAVMLQWLHVPYPSAGVDSSLPDWINDAVMLWAAVWLYRSLQAGAPKRSAVFHVVILFGLLLCLNEAIRGGLMNGYCATRSWSGRGLIALISSMQKGVNFFIVAGFAAGIGQLRNNRLRFAAGAVATSLLVFVVAPSLAALDAAIRPGLVRLVPLDVWCKLPYGMDVLVPAYMTFLEPVFASFICFALIWRCLPSRALAQAASFTLLILALKKQLLMSFLYAAFAPGPFFTLLASMGQFSLEAAALGLLTALSWRYARRDL